MKTWHDIHLDTRSFGDRVADGMASFVGSWTFVILQSIVMAAWILGNAVVIIFHFDPYPFTFLNLFMSAEAAFSTPIIMMSQNRAGERDRANAEHDYQVNESAKEEIEQLITKLDKIEIDKLDRIIELLHANDTTKESS
jgi:uncharacterized membrane protein